MNEDKYLLEIYMLGFNDELQDQPQFFQFENIHKKAYNLGRLDALLGDENSNTDFQTEEEILKRIKE